MARGQLSSMALALSISLADFSTLVNCWINDIAKIVGSVVESISRTTFPSFFIRVLTTLVCISVAIFRSFNQFRFYLPNQIIRHYYDIVPFLKNPPKFFLGPYGPCS